MYSDSVDQIKQMIENYKIHIANTQLKDEVTTVRFNFPKVAERDNRTVYLNYYCH